MTARSLLLSVSLLLSLSSLTQAALVVNIVAGAGLSGNAAALAAFNRAANQWSNIFTDNITVNISADLVVLGPGILGSASSVLLQADYNTIRNAIVADAADEADDSIVAALPTAAQFAATVPAGFSLANAIVASKANLKALGFAGLDGIFGATDAIINFSSTFGFDFDNSDGVGGGLFDFETVAAHEIGHALGFFSVVDTIDNLQNAGTPGQVGINPLDLFRFSAADTPDDISEFTTTSRNLVPGASAVFDDVTVAYDFSTGVNLGDGRQASHWKDNGLTGTLLGIMDPTLAPGTIVNISAADIRGLDVIGYDFLDASVPEPSMFALLGIGMSCSFLAARKRDPKKSPAQPS